VKNCSQGDGVALAPLDASTRRSRQRSRDGEHARPEVQPDDLALRPDGDGGLPCEDTRAAREIEHALTRAELGGPEHVLGPGVEDRRDEKLLVHFGRIRGA
jgi:hypothetical protein